MVVIPKKNDFSSNRLNFVLAVVFLLGASLVFRLYKLQISQGDGYTDKATKQQQIYSRLEPSRGQIFINDYSESLKTNELSALAVNKNFATVYVVPKDLPEDQRDFLAKKIYEVFDKLDVEKQVDKFLAEQDKKDLEDELNYIDSLSLSPEEKKNKKAEVINRRNSLFNDLEWAEFRKIKRDLEINERQQVIVDSYLARINKPEDPYEVLKKKVSDDYLLLLYSSLLSNDQKQVTPEQLVVKNSLVYLNDETGDGNPVNYKGLGYEMQSYRYYPENEMASHILGFVNYEKKGNYGLEEYFNDELSGKEGYMKSERGAGAGKKTIILNDREYIKPEEGQDLVLTIDRAVELYVCKKLQEAEARYKYESATIIVVNPTNGEIIAMCSWPDFNPNSYSEVEDINVFLNPAISQQYEPGSVFKTLTMAAALDQEKVTPDTLYEDKGQIMIDGWSKPISNSDFSTVGAHGQVSMKVVLEKSLNTGAIFVMEQIGANVFADYIKKFSFGEKTKIELGAEASGNISSLLREKIRPVDAATASFGQGISVTPLQMIMSYAAIANGGVLMKPYIVKEIVDENGQKEVTKPQELRRVVSAEAARTTSAMLVEVVENGHSQSAAVSGYYVGGKTGTAQIASSKGGYLENQYIHTFVGYAPIDKPRFVMLVKMDKPKGFKYAESSVAPIFGDIANFLLKYYQVPKERE